MSSFKNLKVSVDRPLSQRLKLLSAAAGLYQYEIVEYALKSFLAEVFEEKPPKIPMGKSLQQLRQAVGHGKTQEQDSGPDG